MRLLRTSLLSAALLVVSWTTARADDDLILLQRIIISGAAEGPREQMQYYSPSMRVTDDERFRSIIDLDNKTLTSINKSAKTYSVVTFAELNKRYASHDQRVKDLPPQVRDMIHADDKVTLLATGKTENIAGYPAKEYGINGKGVTGTVWVTDKLAFGARNDEWLRLADLFGGKSTPGGHLDDALAELKGVPLRRTVRMEPLPLVTTEVVQVKRGPIPAELKRVPQGFTKTEPAAGRGVKPTPSPAAP